MARDIVMGLCLHRGVDKLWGSATVARAPVRQGLMACESAHSRSSQPQLVEPH
jgi:hypothetical protein